MIDNLPPPTSVYYEGYTAKLALQSVGKGWRHLIKIALRMKPDHVKIVQVKEKYGTLRIYVESTKLEDRSYFDVIQALESVSAYTCETCGNKGSIDTSTYWIRTLCPVCKEARRKQRELR